MDTATATIKEKTDNSVTVEIPLTRSNATRATKPLETQKTHEAINEAVHKVYKSYRTNEIKVVGRKIEACCDYSDKVVKSDCGFHPLMAAAHLAYIDHRPLVLSPDIIWLAIAQGVALHINQNADALRKRFVSHEGKAKIIVRRDDFIRLSPENPWQDVFSAFSGQIKEFIGDANYGSMVQKFSSTTPVEQAAFEVALMDGMQSYFYYEFQTLCNIPEVTLKGTPDDWKKILGALAHIETFDLGWWTSRLKTIVQQLLATSEGKADPEFWNSIYKLGHGSGGPYASGWIVQLLPYITDSRGKFYKNSVVTDKQTFGGGIGTADFTSGLSAAPFQWLYHGAEFPYEFVGGFVGVRQDEQSLALTPKIGWAVRERPEEKPA